MESYSKEYIRRPLGAGSIESIHPFFIDFHRLVVNSDYDYPVHRHIEYEVIWVGKGPYICSLNGELLEIDDSCVLVIKPGDVHQDFLKKGQDHLVLHFQLKQNIFNPDAAPYQQAGVSGFKDAEKIFHDIKSESAAAKNADRFSSSIQDALLEVLFWRIIRILPLNGLSETFHSYTQKQDFIERLYSIFSANLKDSVSMDSLAAQMGVSKRTLTNRCKDYFNDSPAKLYKQYRLRQAQTLLLQGHSPIKEICCDLGFDSPANFSREFRKHFGLSPGEIRKRHS